MNMNDAITGIIFYLNFFPPSCKDLSEDNLKVKLAEAYEEREKFEIKSKVRFCLQKYFVHFLDHTRILFKELLKKKVH